MQFCLGKGIHSPIIVIVNEDQAKQQWNGHGTIDHFE